MLVVTLVALRVMVSVWAAIIKVTVVVERLMGRILSVTAVAMTVVMLLVIIVIVSSLEVMIA